MPTIPRSVTSIACLALAGCVSSSKLAVSPDVDFSPYKYVVVAKTGESSSASVYGLEVELGNLFHSRGYSVVGDKEVAKWSDAEQRRVIEARGAISSSQASSVCTIVLDDYVTGRTLVSARGQSGLGWSMEDDRQNAMREAMRELEKALVRK